MPPAFSPFGTSASAVPLSDAECAALLAMSLAVLGASVLFLLDRDSRRGARVDRQSLGVAFRGGQPRHAGRVLRNSHPEFAPAAAARRRRVRGPSFSAPCWARYSCTGSAAGCASIARPLRLPDWLALPLVILGILGGGVLVTAAVTRATLIAYTGIRPMHPLVQRCFMFVVACVGPLAGLWLNRGIPFPVDFQSPVVYLLAFLNGIALMLPVVRSIFWHRAIWLAQCVLFPFSAYFFPRLPAVAADEPLRHDRRRRGISPARPVVLGITHAYRLADGFREEVRERPRVARGVARHCRRACLARAWTRRRVARPRGAR